jgi:subtilisin family serine protease
MAVNPTDRADFSLDAPSDYFGDWMKRLEGLDKTKYKRLQKLKGKLEIVLIDTYLERAKYFDQDKNRRESLIEFFIICENFPYIWQDGHVQPIDERFQPHVIIDSSGQMYWRADVDKAEQSGDLPTTDREGYLWWVLLNHDTIDGLLCDLDSFESLAERLGLVQIRTAPGLRGQLTFSVPEINAGRAQLPAASQAHDGSGVVVGVVDYGCDFAHVNFRTPPGDGHESRTRLLWLWDQNEGVVTPLAQQHGEGRPPGGSAHGREFSHSSLNEALRAADPYEALGYDPDRRGFSHADPEARPGATPADRGGPWEELGAHGTHVMDIAAGNGNAGAHGVAPGAQLVFVHVRAKAYTDIAPISPAAVLDGVSYVFWRARQEGLPAVVNLSLNGNSGPHDGTTPIDIAFDRLLRQPKRAIVVSAGNYRDAGLHASGAVAHYAPRTLTWRFREADRSPNQLEIWHEATDGDGDLEVILIAPSGEESDPIRPGAVHALQRGGERIGLAIGSRLDTGSDARRIVIRLEPRGREEEWRIRLRVPASNGGVHFHAWIERDDSGQSHFIRHDADEFCTLGSLACGARTIVVGAYHALLDSRKSAHYSSQGPTRLNRHKPDVSAPGHKIWAARSKGYRLWSPGNPWRTAGTIAKSGTSMAAPHATGVVALLLQQAPATPLDDIAATLRATARRPEGDHRNWDAGYGAGRIDAGAALGQLAPRPGPGGGTATAQQAPGGGKTVSSGQGGRRGTGKSGRR